jgi:hypothetical protein
MKKEKNNKTSGKFVVINGLSYEKTGNILIFRGKVDAFNSFHTYSRKQK